jgi:hypothetical protein
MYCVIQYHAEKQYTMFFLYHKYHCQISFTKTFSQCILFLPGINKPLQVMVSKGVYLTLFPFYLQSVKIHVHQFGMVGDTCLVALALFATAPYF